MCSHFDGFQSRIAGARDAMRCEDESLNVGNLGSHESRSDKEREIATLRALALVAHPIREAAAHDAQAILDYVHAISGETDFPCMSSRRVGQGRVYVQLPQDQPLDFTAWCRGLASGRSYVSDGFAHPVSFRVDGRTAGDTLSLDKPGRLTVSSAVAFAERMPLGVAYGGVVPETGRQNVGDTILLHEPRHDRLQIGGKRTVELIVNGRVAARRQVPADGKLHKLTFQVDVTRSSWIAIRNFPQFHTNPVNVLVEGKPIRASRASARWMEEMTRLLWQNREKRISPQERPAARATFNKAINRYRQIAKESPTA